MYINLNRTFLSGIFLIVLTHNILIYISSTQLHIRLSASSRNLKTLSHHYSHLFSHHLEIYCSNFTINFTLQYGKLVAFNCVFCPAVLYDHLTASLSRCPLSPRSVVILLPYYITHSSIEHILTRTVSFLRILCERKAHNSNKWYSNGAIKYKTSRGQGANRINFPSTHTSSCTTQGRTNLREYSFPYSMEIGAHLHLIWRCCKYWKKTVSFQFF